MIAASDYLQQGGTGTLAAGSAKDIFKLLRESSDVDFSKYSQPSFLRRLAKRMSALRIQSLEDYSEILRTDPVERDHLFETLLIPTTSFFREKAAFVALKQIVFPQLISTGASSDPVRIWIPGCSSGEEVYSIAIALTEYLERAKSRSRFQIFATDTSPKAIQQARYGLYPERIRKMVTAKQLNQFFSFDCGFYRVHNNLRNHVVFARQTLGVDPPLGRMDLISCQNVLIYFGPDLPKQVIREFYFALRADRYLLLGPAESIGIPGLFKRATKTCKLFRKIANTEETIAE